jgi:hypothetical protein
VPGTEENIGEDKFSNMQINLQITRTQVAAYVYTTPAILEFRKPSKL